MFISIAYRFERASRLSPLLYFSVLGSFIVDLTLFHTHFSLLKLAGASLIVLCIALFLANQLKSRPA